MLCFLVRLVEDFRATHGYAPNLLYLSPAHYQTLLSETPGFDSHEALIHFLNMDIVLSADSVHPHAGWVRPRHFRRAVGE